MKDNRRVLAVGAHPDDVEFSCGGTLALLRQKGYEVATATMTAGNGGSQELSTFDIGNTRRKEAAASAELIGAQYFCMEVDDLAVDVTPELRRKVTELIRTVDPFMIFCPPLDDYLFDHENTGRLVRDATFCANVPLYGSSAGKKATAGLANLYYCAPVTGYDNYGRFVKMPTVIDITSAIETKKQMLACHASQRNWLREKHGMDEYTESGLAWSAKTGELAGFTYAEGFRQHLGPFYPHDDILLNILDGRKLEEA